MRRRRRAVAGALALVLALAVGVFVAQLGWSARGAHQPTVLEWLLQLGVLAVAGIVVVRRVTGKS
jgi:predicted exporter